MNNSQNRQPIVFGIDLGTTNTCIGMFQQNQLDILEIDGNKILPSVMTFDGEYWHFGHKALDRLADDPASIIYSVKRYLGTNHTFQVKGHQFSPVELTAKLLNFLKINIMEKYSLLVEDVVISVPSYFNDLQRRDTLEAGKLANLNILRIINEPTAASLIYELDSNCSISLLSSINQENSRKNSKSAEFTKSKNSTSENWIIYDFGGGTFDVTILNVKPHYKEVLSSTGDLFLGGDDFDFKIAQYLFKILNLKFEDDKFYNSSNYINLKIIAENIRKNLSFKNEVYLNQNIVIDQIQYKLDLTITKEFFEELISDYIEFSIEKIYSALNKASCSKEEIDKVILVGGLTRTPCIKNRLIKEFGDIIHDYIDPDLSVALGATLQAALCKGLFFDELVLDVSPFTVGIAAIGEVDYIAYKEKLPYSSTSEKNFSYSTFGPNRERITQIKNHSNYQKISETHPKTFVPIISKNSKLPIHVSRIFYTSILNQKSIEIALYQGESTKIIENYFIGSLTIELKPLPINYPISVEISYDLNGIIKVGAIDFHQNAILSSQFFYLNKLDHSLNNPKKSDSQNILNANDSDTCVSVQNLQNNDEEFSFPICNHISFKIVEIIKSMKDKNEIKNLSQLLNEYLHKLNDPTVDCSILDEMELTLYNIIDSLEISKNEFSISK